MKTVVAESYPIWCQSLAYEGEKSEDDFSFFVIDLGSEIFSLSTDFTFLWRKKAAKSNFSLRSVAAKIRNKFFYAKKQHKKKQRIIVSPLLHHHFFSLTFSSGKFLISGLTIH